MARHARRRRLHRDGRADRAMCCAATPPINACRSSPISPRSIRRRQPSTGLEVRATGYGEPFAYRPEDRPAMAVDGDPATAWLVADRFDPIGQRHRGVRRCLRRCRLLQSQQSGASRMISSVRLDFDGAPPQVVDLDDTSLHGAGQTHRCACRGDVRAHHDHRGRSPSRVRPTPGRRLSGSPNSGSARTARWSAVPSDTTDVSPTTPAGHRPHPAAHRPAQPLAQRPRTTARPAVHPGLGRDLAPTFTVAPQRSGVR